MRSALTSALSSKGTQAPAPPQLQDDTFSFPCLNEDGTQKDTINSLTQSFERFDVRKGASLPGSARVRMCSVLHVYYVIFI